MLHLLILMRLHPQSESPLRQPILHLFSLLLVHHALPLVVRIHRPARLALATFTGWTGVWRGPMIAPGAVGVASELGWLRVFVRNLMGG